MVKKLLALFFSCIFIINISAQPCDSIKITIETSDTHFCAGDVVTLKAKVENTSKKVKYSWSNGSDSSSTWFIAKNNTTISLNATVYRCIGTYTDKQEITVDNNKPEINYEYNGRGRSYYSVSNLGGRLITIRVTALENQSNSSYQIKNGTIEFKEIGTFRVYFKTTGTQCLTIDSFTTLVKADDLLPLRLDTFTSDTIYIPNTIVQNPKSYINGQFFPIGNLKSYSISIYSRRGNRVFYCDEPKCFWDGTDSKGMLVPSGGYFYVIKGINSLGEENIFTGALNVIF